MKPDYTDFNKHTAFDHVWGNGAGAALAEAMTFGGMHVVVSSSSIREQANPPDPPASNAKITGAGYWINWLDEDDYVIGEVRGECYLDDPGGIFITRVDSDTAGILHHVIENFGPSWGNDWGMNEVRWAAAPEYADGFRQMGMEDWDGTIPGGGNRVPMVARGWSDDSNPKLVGYLKARKEANP